MKNIIILIAFVLSSGCSAMGPYHSRTTTCGDVAFGCRTTESWYGRPGQVPGMEGYAYGQDGPQYFPNYPVVPQYDTNSPTLRAFFHRMPYQSSGMARVTVSDDRVTGIPSLWVRRMRFDSREVILRDLNRFEPGVPPGATVFVDVPVCRPIMPGSDQYEACRHTVEFEAVGYKTVWNGRGMFYLPDNSNVVRGCADIVFRQGAVPGENGIVIEKRHIGRPCGGRGA